MATIINNCDLPELDSYETYQVYNSLDCCITLEVWEAINSQLDPETQQVYDLSRALQAPVLEMAIRGIRVDQARRDQVLARFERRVKFLRLSFQQIVRDGIGIEVNPNSPVDLQRLFYEVLGLKPIRKRNAEGRMVPTVDRNALERLRLYFNAQPLIAHLLLIRDLNKKIGFLRTGIDPDGRMRSNLNIAGTVTGRMASSESDYGTGTNLQNVTNELRSIFIPDPGYVFANYDLEQADSRNVGANCWQNFYDTHGPEFAGAYLDACESGDLHTTVCRMAWTDLAWGEDPKGFRAVADQIAYRHESYRQLAKKCGHGTNYFATPPTIALHTKLPVELAKEFQTRYFGAFPCIKADHEVTKRQLRERGTITTLFNRRRTFFGRAEEDKTIRDAVAYKGQSPTADEINNGMVSLWRWSHTEDDLHLLMQVHDSILMQVREDKLDELKPQIRERMTTRLVLKGDREFSVPVEGKFGQNWGDFDRDKNPTGLRKG